MLLLDGTETEIPAERYALKAKCRCVRRQLADDWRAGKYYNLSLAKQPWTSLIGPRYMSSRSKFFRILARYTSNSVSSTGWVWL